MKKLTLPRTCLCLLVFISAAAHAADGVSESRFRLLTTRCGAESKEGPEATPQSPPLQVDDPGTPGCNRWEINVLADGDLTSSQSALELPLLDVNYGIGDNLQLKYEVPYVATQASDSTRNSAVGESRVGIKYKFYDDEARELELAIYPQLSFVGSGSDAVQKGMATAGTVTTLPVLMTMKIAEIPQGEVDLTANLGYNISTKEGQSNFVSASVGVGLPLTTRISAMGELTTEQATGVIGEDARDQLVRADLGLMTVLSRKFLLFGAVGHSLYASDDLSHTYALAGLRLNIDSGSSSGDQFASYKGAHL